MTDGMGFRVPAKPNLWLVLAHILDVVGSMRSMRGGFICACSVYGYVIQLWKTLRFEECK